MIAPEAEAPPREVREQLELVAREHGLGAADLEATGWRLRYIPGKSAKSGWCAARDYVKADETTVERRFLFGLPKHEGRWQFPWKAKGKGAYLALAVDDDGRLTDNPRGAAVLLVCEGEPDSLVAWSCLPKDGRFAVLGVTGANMVEGLAPFVGEGAIVVLALDGDRAGDECAEVCRAELVEAGLAPSSIFRLRPEIPGRAKADLRDLLEAAAAAGEDPGEVLQQAIVTAPRAEELVAPARHENGASRTGDGPEIQTTARPMADVTGDALAALAAANDPPELYVRSGTLARVRRDERGRPLVEVVGEAALRGRMARVAAFVRRAKGGESYPTPPPRETVADLLALGGWPFPPLVGVTEAPTLRPDGTVHDAPGYDAATGAVYMPPDGLEVPAVSAAPTATERAAARALLEEAIADFPFADPASRANALGLMLTPILRPAIAGPVPLALLDAPRAGTGKGLLASVVAIIATGRPAAALPAPHREEEWAKVILAQLLAGRSFVLLDEVDELRSGALAAVLTAPEYEDRVLGRSEVVRLPVRVTWAAAGNNLSVSGDLPRRCYWVRLDAEVAQPWRRTGFRHPDLTGWATERRGDLLAALLTLSRAWYAAGRPAASSVPVLGSFGDWSRTVGGVLELAGVEGFLGNLEAFWDRADEDAAAWEAFLTAWHARFGSEPVPAGAVADLLLGEGADREFRDTLPDDLVAALDKSDASFRATLGRALGKRERTRYGERNLRVVRAAKVARGGAAFWEVLADA